MYHDELRRPLYMNQDDVVSGSGFYSQDFSHTKAKNPSYLECHTAVSSEIKLDTHEQVSCSLYRGRGKANPAVNFSIVTITRRKRTRSFPHQHVVSTASFDHAWLLKTGIVPRAVSQYATANNTRLGLAKGKQEYHSLCFFSLYSFLAGEQGDRNFSGESLAI